MALNPRAGHLLEPRLPCRQSVAATIDLPEAFGARRALSLAIPVWLRLRARVCYSERLMDQVADSLVAADTTRSGPDGG